MSLQAGAGMAEAVSPAGGGPAAKRRRRSARTALACTFCRRRKIRCSGDWPACATCTRQKRDCFYPGSLPAPVSQRVVDDAGPVATPSGPDSGGGSEPSCLVPPEGLRRGAISYFRQHYAPTLLCFIPPQQLVDDPLGDNLPMALLLCIVSLTLRFLPDSGSKEDSHISASDSYAELARKELSRSYEDPSLVAIQCCLVLSVHEIGKGSEYRGWLRLGHAARLAQLLRLHKQDSDLGLMDWGDAVAPASVTAAESKRRTFWCCFCLEKLLANGRDRIPTFNPEDITTRFSQTDENFIYGRQSPTCAFHCPDWGTEHSRHADQSVMAHTIQIVEIFSRIVSWNGRGGRHLDDRCPWVPDMPFTILDQRLEQWESSLPPHLKYSPQNMSAVIAVGQGQLWSIMWMVFFQARSYLHREYLPFTPKPDYDPTNGPCDGPTLAPAIPNDGFWYKSARTMVQSANAISDLYWTMEARGLAPSAYPLPGLGLLVAATIHVVCAIFHWDGMQSIMTQEESMAYLRRDMNAFNHLGQHWLLGTHWVSLYYKLNSLTKLSWVDGNNPSPFSMNIKEIKDGVMNFVRQVSVEDRDTRATNCGPMFDFEGWLNALEHSIKSADKRPGRNVPAPLTGVHERPPTPGLTHGGNSWDVASIMNGGGFCNLDGLGELFLGDTDGEWLLEDWA